jgi:hypothetical protein
MGVWQRIGAASRRSKQREERRKDAAAIERFLNDHEQHEQDHSDWTYIPPPG